MQIVTKIEGDKEVQKAIDRLAKLNKQALKKALVDSAAHVVKEAKKIVPRSTSNLGNSIKFELLESGDNIHARVGTNVEYAPYVEFGIKNTGKFKKSKTGKLLAPVGSEWASKHGFGDTEFLYISGKAKPYLLPAFKNSRDKIIKFITNAIKSVKAK